MFLRPSVRPSVCISVQIAVVQNAVVVVVVVVIDYGTSFVGQASKHVDTIVSFFTQ